MGWTRMQAEEERRPQTMRGFWQFILGNEIVGRLRAIKVKDNRGFYIIEYDASASGDACKINLRQDDVSTTADGEAKDGELVGVRKVGATKRLSELPIGTLIRMVYNGTKSHTGVNRETGVVETNQAHDITIDVFKEEI